MKQTSIAWNHRRDQTRHIILCGLGITRVALSGSTCKGRASNDKLNIAALMSIARCGDFDRTRKRGYYFDGRSVDTASTGNSKQTEEWKGIRQSRKDLSLGRAHVRKARPGNETRLRPARRDATASEEPRNDEAGEEGGGEGEEGEEGGGEGGEGGLSTPRDHKRILLRPFSVN